MMMEREGSQGEIRLHHLRKSYGEVVAVKDLSLDIEKGEIFGFLGPNGAGKTTTINMICGLLKKDAGEIEIDGCEIEEDKGRGSRMIGLCPQDIVIWDSLTCLEQLEFTARLYDIPRSAARERSLEMLGVFGLEEKKQRLAKTLSGGMKRRLNIALALVHDPHILILDEPQAGLDPQSRILVREFIRSLSGEKTVILTTHDMDEADRLAQRIGIIDHGELLVLDTSENLKDQVGEGDILEIKITESLDDKMGLLKSRLPKNLSHLDTQHDRLRFVGSNIPDVLSELLETCKHLDLKIEDMTIRKKTLEDVFISLTGRRLRE
jgi:ABC-2 type transport system ATP-binding protein